MPQDFHKFRLPPENGYPVIDANSNSKTRGDAVFIDSSGWLSLVSAGSKVLGFSLETVSISGTIQTVALVRSQYVPQLGVLMLFGTTATITQTDIGDYHDFSTVTTGAFDVVLGAGANTETLLLLGAEDPLTLGTNGIFQVAEPQDLGFAVVA